MNLITDDERALCATAIRLDYGPYQDHWHRESDAPFVVDLDAEPLLLLAESASRGDRVYELMRIHRPGDVMHYVRIQSVALSQYLWGRIKDHHVTDGRWGPMDGSRIPFVAFDKLFVWQGDDTGEESSLWLRHRERDAFWRDWPSRLLDMVKGWQSRLRDSEDALTLHEIGLMDRCIHKQDFEPVVRRVQYPYPRKGADVVLPSGVLEVIRSLAARDEVKSVYYPFEDLPAWRMLVLEQVRRTARLGLPPREAFDLVGPDGGLGFDPRDWGGEVHIPYEGLCIRDVLVEPNWFYMALEESKPGEPLTTKWKEGSCIYLLTRKDRGEIAAARRTVLSDGWLMYAALTQADAEVVSR